MVETEQKGAIEKEVRIAARPETVFQFFVDPEKMLRWKGVEATLEPRPGGIYRVDMNGSNIAVGEYVEVSPPNRVVFTWGWEDTDLPPGSTTVEVTLTPDGNDTVVRLRHLGLPEDQRQAHLDGWKHFLERLVVAGSGGDPGPDPWVIRECGLHKLISDVSVMADGKVLMVRYADTEKYDNQKGWFLPDTLLSDLEHPEAAAQRVLKGELGLADSKTSLSHIESFKGNDGTWHLAFHYRADLDRAVELSPTDNVKEGRWFPLDQLPTRSQVAHHGWALRVLKEMAAG